MFELFMNAENDAFQSGNGTEMARILRELADRLDGTELEGGEAFKLYDENGNSVGMARMQEPR